MGENARFVDGCRRYDGDDVDGAKDSEIYIQITICQSFCGCTRVLRCPVPSRLQHIYAYISILDGGGGGDRISRRGETAEKEKRKFDLSFEHLIDTEITTTAAAAAAAAPPMPFQREIDIIWFDIRILSAVCPHLFV